MNYHTPDNTEAHVAYYYFFRQILNEKVVLLAGFDALDSIIDTVRTAAGTMKGINNVNRVASIKPETQTKAVQAVQPFSSRARGTAIRCKATKGTGYEQASTLLLYANDAEWLCECVLRRAGAT